MMLCVFSGIVEGSYHYLGSRGSDHHEYQLNCPLQTMKDLNLVFKNKTHSYIDVSINILKSKILSHTCISKVSKENPRSAFKWYQYVHSKQKKIINLVILLKMVEIICL